MSLHQEFLRLHGIHRVLHEALPIVKVCPEVVAVWAESSNGRDWEPRFEVPDGRSTYRAGTEVQLIECLRDWRRWHSERRDAVSYPGAIKFWRHQLMGWQLARCYLRDRLERRNDCTMAWYASDVVGTTGEVADMLRRIRLHKDDNGEAIDRGTWLPRDFLVFGDEPAPVPFERDVFRNVDHCDSCGEPVGGISGSVWPIAALNYTACHECVDLTPEEFIAGARALRLRHTHRPDTGLPRQVARFDTAAGEVLFIDGIMQPPAPPKPSLADERRAAKVKQHLEYLSTPTAQLVKELKQ